MIFVTVGMHTQSFHRLIEPMDAFAAEHDEPVVMQVGHSRYLPRHSAWFRFADYREMVRSSIDARVVVCHGATSILTALRQGTPVVAVPRERRFDEHIDDHQVEFVDALAVQGWITTTRDTSRLRSILRGSLPAPRTPGTPSLTKTLRELMVHLG